MAPLNLNDKCIVLLLQGGGALGSYQVGAFRALSEVCHIDWLAGISIGAINAAVIAGHRSPGACRELESLWDEILSPPYPPYDCTQLLEACPPHATGTWQQALEPRYAGWLWSAFNISGQPNFFSSRVLDPLENPWVLQWFQKVKPNQLSFYDTAPLRETLNRHVDWNSLRRPGSTRLSVGAAQLSDGEVVFFDSGKCRLGPEHVMASGALPPAFPPIKVSSRWYLDAGISNNTPIEILGHDLIDNSAKDTLVFMIDLWDRKDDKVPESLEELIWRQKSIQFGSRKKSAETVVRMHQYQAQLGRIPRVHLEVCEVMRESSEKETHFSYGDADFLRATYKRLTQQGYDDMRSALAHPEPVSQISGEYATLYRYGSAHKHRTTDERISADLFQPVR